MQQDITDGRIRNSMKNEYCIRKAVGLADGWHLEHNDEYVDNEYMWELRCVDDMPQTVLDALAAQLTRQVDDQVGCLELVITDGETGIWDQANCIHSTAGDDRTLNTIKAIIDSKVLE